MPPRSEVKSIICRIGRFPELVMPVVLSRSADGAPAHRRPERSTSYSFVIEQLGTEQKVCYRIACSHRFYQERLHMRLHVQSNSSSDSGRDRDLLILARGLAAKRTSRPRQIFGDA